MSTKKLLDKLAVILPIERLLFPQQLVLYLIYGTIIVVFENLGSTCWLNCVFPAFNPTSAITNVVENFAVDVDNDSRAAVLYNEIVLDVFRHFRFKAPKEIPDNKLKNIMKNYSLRYRGGKLNARAQQDASEFMNKVLVNLFETYKQCYTVLQRYI